MAIEQKKKPLVLRIPKRKDCANAAEEFEKMAAWGAAHAKKLGLDTRPQAIVRAQHKRRAKA